MPDKTEEDWQLVVATTDTTLNGPQIISTMSPTGDNANGLYVAFDINYREYPDYTPGGLQLQVFRGKSLLKTSSLGSSQLSNSTETITWTPQLALSNGSPAYNINNSQSTTRGKFRQGNGLLDVTFSTSLGDLSGHNPQTTVANSAATWMSDHVSSLSLVEVRCYSNVSFRPACKMGPLCRRRGSTASVDGFLSGTRGLREASALADGR